MADTRLFFATDVHGNSVCWQKFLKMPEIHNVNVMVLGGDLTGKAIVPIVRQKDNTYIYDLFRKKHELRDLKAVEKAAEDISGITGYYTLITSPEEMAMLERDQVKLREIFENLQKERLRKWMALADEKLKGDVKNVRIFASGGNDDTPAINSILKESKSVTYCEDRVVDVDAYHKMISLSWVNPSPWNTPREASEEQLEEMYAKLFAQVSNYENLICNFHAPPFDSGLDTAPKLDKTLKPEIGMFGIEAEPVGSKATRKAIEKYQPLLGLHGHIHESSGERKIGRTLCVNPGSEYGEKILRGYIFDLTPEGISKHWRVYG